MAVTMPDDNFCVIFSDSGRDHRKRLYLPRNDFLAHDSCFKGAAELSGNSVDFKPTCSRNMEILSTYLRQAVRLFVRHTI